RLPRSVQFCVYAFAAEILRSPDRGWARTRDVSDGDAISDAVAWLRNRKPAGGSNLYGALLRALEEPSGPDTIVVLTDGVPYRCLWHGKTYSEPEQILAEVRRANEGRGVRIHAVALLAGARFTTGDEDPLAASEFLRRLADENGGDFREAR
ncbi:MAG: hypothetical protein ACREID_03280, partial [Planctomycetota bacterium]